MILHIPHSSTVIPKEYRSLINLTDEELAAEHRYMCDMYTDELFDYRCTKIIAPVSRLICDVERFENDADEEMATIGMGVCYTHDHNLCQFKTVTPEHREEILKKYYRPHHKTLERETEKDIEKYNDALIIDCHSFSSTVLPYEKNNERPDICIGINEENIYADKIIKILSENFTVAINKPFSGSIVPKKYMSFGSPVFSVMIEINRSLYMNERTGKKTNNFNNLKKILFNLFKELEQIQKTSIHLNRHYEGYSSKVLEKSLPIFEAIVKNKPLNKIKKQIVLESTIDIAVLYNSRRTENNTMMIFLFKYLLRTMINAYERKEIKKEEAITYLKNEYFNNYSREIASDFFEFRIEKAFNKCKKIDLDYSINKVFEYSKAIKNKNELKTEHENYKKEFEKYMK